MMPESQPGERFNQSVKNRLRDTCIIYCAKYSVLKSFAESEQEKVNAARAAGKKVSGSYVKLICPYDPGLECPGFVHVPTIEGNIEDGTLDQSED